MCTCRSDFVDIQSQVFTLPFSHLCAFIREQKENFCHFYAIVWSKSSATFWTENFFLKRTHIGVIWCGESIVRIYKAWKRFPDSGKTAYLFMWKRKTFEFWPKNRAGFRAQIRIFYIFASINTPLSLNQGQESVFTRRKCAQSISRIKLSLYGSF